MFRILLLQSGRKLICLEIYNLGKQYRVLALYLYIPGLYTYISIILQEDEH